MEIVTRAEATKLGLTHYFTGNSCVHGHLSKRRVSDRVCMACDLAYQKNAYKADPEKRKVAKKASYERTKEHHLAQKRKYRQANKGKINALVAARKKVIKQRTPAWLSDFDKLKIKCLYQIAAMLTRENKEPWHVDHIIPLQGKKVSGLHTPSNLRFMRGSDNISKKNRFEVV